jgi:hypothetical protein
MAHGQHMLVRHFAIASAGNCAAEGLWVYPFYDQMERNPMKRFAVLSYSLALSFAVAGVCLSFGARADYPSPEAPPQKVYVLHRGAALLAHVASERLTTDVIGYKASGYLAQRRPEAIDAVITARCPASEQAKTTVIKLGPELHGTGYMSGPLDLRTLFPAGEGPQGCPVRSDTPLQVSFSDGAGRWDPAGYNDIIFSLYEFFQSRSIRQVPGEGEGVNVAAWDYIVNEMRR